MKSTFSWLQESEQGSAYNIQSPLTLLYGDKSISVSAARSDVKECTVPRPEPWIREIEF
jgi:hypothetical protein